MISLLRAELIALGAYMTLWFLVALKRTTNDVADIAWAVAMPLLYLLAKLLNDRFASNHRGPQARVVNREPPFLNKTKP